MSIPELLAAAMVLAALERRGHTFSTAFVVDEVWILEDGSEALLGLEIPPGLVAATLRSSCPGGRQMAADV
ncbi:hypothetical protein LCGC14_2697340 [marine sediment metagenome]|uniref:Uncharacterized protein n=1 Tax=marine sediment metagenome TaxID=412755 RepID=A0A0F8ZGX6_9ZZZZ